MHLCQSASATLTRLTRGLAVGETRAVASSVLPVELERVADRLYSVTHYVEQDGTRLADPKLVFYREAELGSAHFRPAHYTQETEGVERCALELDASGRPQREDLVMTRKLTQLANLMLNAMVT
jgi:hypothetical protein